MELDFSFFGFSPKPRPRQLKNHLGIKGTKTTTLNVKTKNGTVNPERIQSLSSSVEVDLNLKGSRDEFCSEVLSKTCVTQSMMFKCRQEKENNCPNTSYNNSFHEDKSFLHVSSKSYKEVISTATFGRDDKSLLEATGFELNLQSSDTYPPHSKNTRTIASLVRRSISPDKFNNVFSKPLNDSVIVISDSDSSSGNVSLSITKRHVIDQKSKLKKGIATRRRANVPSSGGSSSSSGSRVIRKTHNLKTIILESSDDEHGVSLNISKPAKILVDDVFKVPQLTETKQRDIETWLQGNVHSDTESNHSINNLSLEKLSTPQMIAKSKESRRNDVKSAKKVLDELYGKAWRTTPNVLKHYSSVSETESEDGFDQFVKKYNSCKKQLHKSSDEDNANTHTLSLDFIDDESTSVENVGFYQGIAVLKKNATEIETDNTLLKKDTFTSINKCSEEILDKQKLFKSRKHAEPEARPQKTKVTNKSSSKNITTTLAENIHIKYGPSKIQESKPQVSARSFMESLSASTPPLWCDPEAEDFKKHFHKKKDALYSKLFQIFNSTIFENKLPKDMKLEWNPRLNCTAGFCYNRRLADPSSLGERIRSSRIELSTKVCDTPERLRDTLVHELCHAATWVVNGIQNGHGKWWKAWAARARHCFPELPEISRCHDYAIETKYTYECQLCGYSIGRHSKSLDTVTKRCGYCYGVFKLIINYKGNKGGKVLPKTNKPLNGFALYVKENYTSVKSRRLDLKHGEIMKLLGQQFSATKIG